MSLSDPTVRSQELGDELRRLREEAHCSLAAAGKRIDASASKVCRIESGYVTATPEDVAALLVVYGVTGPRRRELLELAREAEKLGWWQRDRHNFAKQARTLISLEERANTIINFETVVIPGLLQTREYTRSLMANCGYVPAEEVEDRTSLRQERQTILKRRSAPNLLAIVDELALHRPIGGPEVFRHQLLHLAHAAARPNITVLVVPNDGRAHPGIDGAFILIRRPHLSSVVLTGNLTSSLILEESGEINQYNSLVRDLSERALDQEQSMELVSTLAHDGPNEKDHHERTLAS